MTDAPTPAQQTPRPAQQTPRMERLFVFFGLVIVSLVYRWDLVALNPAKWATLSAWALLCVGIAIAEQLDDRFMQMLQRLQNRQAMTLTADEFGELLKNLQKRAGVAATAGGVLLPVILLAAYLLVYRNAVPDVTPLALGLLVSEIALETISAVIVGRYVGRGIFYGFLGKQLASDNVKINMIFGHSDNAAGLRPIGDFYFYQATVTALPVFFFAFWVLMMPVWSTMWPKADASFGMNWKNTYVAFFFIALAVELVAFAFPLLHFHQEMKRQKLSLQPLADELSGTLSQLQRDPATDRGESGGESAQLIEQIEMLENLPTWPLAPEVSKRFAIGNLALLAPPAAKMSQAAMDAFSTGLK